jgi:carboxylesterase type B
MTSPLTRGLFQRAIVQSGSAINPPASSLPDCERFGEKIASTLKSPSGEAALEFLRAKSTSELLTAIRLKIQRSPRCLDLMLMDG